MGWTAGNRLLLGPAGNVHLWPVNLFALAGPCRLQRWPDPTADPNLGALMGGRDVSTHSPPLQTFPSQNLRRSIPLCSGTKILVGIRLHTNIALRATFLHPSCKAGDMICVALVKDAHKVVGNHTTAWDMAHKML